MQAPRRQVIQPSTKDVVQKGLKVITRFFMDIYIHQVYYNATASYKAGKYPTLTDSYKSELRRMVETMLSAKEIFNSAVSKIGLLAMEIFKMDRLALQIEMCRFVLRDYSAAMSSEQRREIYTDLIKYVCKALAQFVFNDMRIVKAITECDSEEGKNIIKAAEIVAQKAIESRAAKYIYEGLQSKPVPPEVMVKPITQLDAPPFTQMVRASAYSSSVPGDMVPPVSGYKYVIKTSPPEPTFVTPAVAAPAIALAPMVPSMAPMSVPAPSATIGAEHAAPAKMSEFFADNGEDKGLAEFDLPE